MNMDKVIRTTDELQALRRRGARRGITRVVLALPWDENVLRDAERAINRDLRSCGCEMGSVFVAFALVLAAWRHLFAERASIAMTIALIFAFALVGKATGIVIAELRLRARIARLL
jgi:hypothetical protein